MTMMKLHKDDFLPIPVADVEILRRWCIYGRAGSGKTTFASTFPKPLLLLDLDDKGTDSISDVPGVEVLQLKDWDSFEAIWHWIQQHGAKYQTIVIDTITQAQRFALYKVAKAKEKPTGPPAKRPGDWGSLTIKDWGEVSGKMQDWIINYRDLPHPEIVFLAQERISVTDDSSGADTSKIDAEVGPRVIPSIASTLNASVSIIANMYKHEKTRYVTVGGKKRAIKENSHRLGLRSDPIYTRKVRKPKSIELPDYVEDPTYDDIISILKGE